MLKIIAKYEVGTTVKDAIIRISNGSLTICKRTEEDGVVVFNNIPSMNYEVNAYKVGDCEQYYSRTKVFKEELYLPHNITLEKNENKPTNGVIRFIVMDTLNYNQPLPDIVISEVENYTNNAVIQQKTTDSLGYAEFNYTHVMSLVTHYFIINTDPVVQKQGSIFQENPDITITHS